MGHAREVLNAQEAVFTKDDAGKMTARVQVIKAGRAIGKKRDYTAGALQKAAKEGIYNGLRMFVDHSTKPPTSRKTMEMVSAVESTEWDPKQQAIMGEVEFFSEDFFNFAQRAKKHMGVSADHVISVNYVQEGRDRIERVTSIPMARSVDWVVFPAAGGEILSFAREAEGENDVEWNEVTLDQLKEHAPTLLEEYRKSIAQESEDDEPDDEPDGGEGAKKKKKTAQESVTMSRADIEKLVQEQVTSITTAADKKAADIRAATALTRDFVSKSGLPSRTQARIVNSFSDSEKYDEKVVKEAVDEAKEELKEAGARGPRITGMGPSGETADDTSSSTPQLVQARESVEAVFGAPFKKEDPKKDDKK